MQAVVIKEHLGFYHSFKAHFHDISADNFEDIYRYLLAVDEITVYPFRDNTSFSFTAYIKKAYPYEYSDISKLPTSFYIEAESTGYSVFRLKQVTGWATFEDEFLIPTVQAEGWATFEDQI